MAMKLKKYKYTFTWRHANVASTLSIEVRTPQSEEFVETIANGVTVYHMGTEAPMVRMIVLPLQHVRAILEEIERENSRRPTPQTRREPEES